MRSRQFYAARRRHAAAKRRRWAAFDADCLREALRIRLRIIADSLKMRSGDDEAIVGRWLWAADELVDLKARGYPQPEAMKFVAGVLAQLRVGFVARERRDATYT